MEIRLANTRGFCAGVDRAIEIVKKVIELHGAPVYVKHEVVHNKTVVEELKNLGAIFVEDIEEIPVGEVVVYSAHGISKAVEVQSGERNLDVFDATCPLVSKFTQKCIPMQKWVLIVYLSDIKIIQKLKGQWDNLIHLMEEQ